MMDSISLGKRAMSLETAPAFAPYTGVRLWYDDENAYEAGNTTGRVLEADCPWATQEMADNILASIAGYAYQPYDAAGALLDPSAELGDGVSIGGVYGPLASITTQFDAMCASDILAPSDKEVDHEYPYLSKTERQLARKLTLGADYYGTRITKANGLEIIKRSADGKTKKSRVKLNSDVLAFYNDDGQEALYFDTTTGTYKFRGSVEITEGTININDNFIVDEEGNVVLNGDITWGTGNEPLTKVTYSDLTGALFDAEAAETWGDGIYFDGSNICINASAINLGTLLADYIKLYGDMTVFRTRNGSTSGGSLGYASSTLDGSGGIHMYSSGSEVRATSSGAALEGSSGGSVVCTANVSLTGRYIFFNAGDGCEMAANRFNPLSDWGMDLGMSGQRWGTVYAGGGVVTTSDRAAKKDIEYGLDKYDAIFHALRPCSFRMNHEKADEKIRVGLIVQDIVEELPAAGLTTDDFAGIHLSEKEGESGLDYTQFIALLIDQVQKLKKRIKALEDKS